MTETAIATEPENESLKEGLDGRLWYLNHGPVCTSCESWVPLTPYRYGNSSYEMELQTHMNQCEGIVLKAPTSMIAAEEIKESMERPPEALKEALTEAFKDEEFKHDCCVRIPESVLETINDAIHDMQAQAAFDNARGGSMSRKARARHDHQRAALAIKWLEDVEDSK